MTYDDMPVGTVLRNPDDGDTYIRVVGLSGTWLRVQPGGDACEVRGVEMVPFLVELVEKPATPPEPTRLVDRDGDAWEERADGWHQTMCDHDCPETGNVMPRPGRPWSLFAQGPDLRDVMALLTKARLSMPRRTAFTVLRTETLEAS
jgi:hypothetical protein